MQHHTSLARAAVTLAGVLLAAGLGGAAAQRPLMQPDAFDVVALGEGLHAVVRRDPPDDAANANVLIIINAHDVVVVDGGLTTASADAVIRTIRRLTPHPVRYVVNTHWHDDHVLGNGAYAAAFPGVEFIGHPVTREMVIGSVGPALQRNQTDYADAATAIEARLRAGRRADGQPMSDADRTRARRLSELYRAFVAEIPRINVTPPAVLVDQSLTLWRGSREIRVMHIGRGNTAGDLVVFLPKEGVMAAGDLLVRPIPYAYGSYIGDWIGALDRFEALAPRVILPGHGAVMTDTGYVTAVRDLLVTVRDHMRQAVAQGLTLEAARASLDLDRHRAWFAGDDPGRRQSFDSVFVTPATERAYLEARGELK